MGVPSRAVALAGVKTRLVVNQHNSLIRESELPSCHLIVQGGDSPPCIPATVTVRSSERHRFIVYLEETQLIVSGTGSFTVICEAHNGRFGRVTTILREPGSTENFVHVPGNDCPSIEIILAEGVALISTKPYRF
ncbi:MAG: hypothetical protein M3Y72_22815 [Acidobacteriota bacterium]|nr:hypothetical protein [Acidobacteriota bacterium]MDQ2843816.1 hypothetical protein [Acidobacteriota bacterium]